MTPRGWSLFVALGVIWGIPYLLIRIAVTDFDPLLVAFGRTLVGAVLLVPFAVRRNELRPVLRVWPWLLAFAAVEIIGPWLLLGHAETRLHSSTAGLLVAATPLVAAVVATAAGTDRLGPTRAAGLAVGMLGVGCLVGLDLDLSDAGAVLAVGGTVVGYAIGPLIISHKLADCPRVGVIAAALVVATLAYLPFTPAVWPTAWPADATLAVVLLGVVCTAAAFVLFFSLIGEVGPTRATVITYLNPAVAIAAGVVVLGEPVTGAMLAGFALVIAGSVLATRRTRESRPKPAAAPETEPGEQLSPRTLEVAR